MTVGLRSLHLVVRWLPCYQLANVLHRSARVAEGDAELDRVAIVDGPPGNGVAEGLEGLRNCEVPAMGVTARGGGDICKEANGCDEGAMEARRWWHTKAHGKTAVSSEVTFTGKESSSEARDVGAGMAGAFWGCDPYSFRIDWNIRFE